MAQLTKLGLAPTTTPVPILGTRRLDRKSKDAYLARLRKFIQFLLLHPQFDDSLVMFYPYTPKGTVNVEDKAVAAFLLSMFGEKGKPVNDTEGNPILKFDTEGRPITNADGTTQQLTAFGGWNDPEICDGFRSALAHVHANAHEMAGEYRNVCAQCKHQYETNNKRGCTHHESNPRPSRSGNVTLSTLMNDTIAHIKDASNHKVNGACHLLPGDLRQIRSYCISSNNPHLFCIFVMLLTSIELFLRKMEFTSLHSDNFNTDMFVFTAENVFDALNIKVKGKKKRKKKKRGLATDNATTDGAPVWRYLYIWGDDACPDLDLKRHLMAYLYCIKWKGGYLFPSQDEINNPPQDGVYKTCLSEHDLYKSLEFIFTNILGRKDKLTVHTGRKTGYLFAFLRGGKWVFAMQAADHESVAVAQRYMKDAQSIVQVNACFRDPAQNLGEWRNPFCGGDETAARASRPGSQWRKALPELVQDFMHQQIGVLPTDPRRYEPFYLSQKILDWRTPDDPYLTIHATLRDFSRDRSQEIVSSVLQIETQARQQGRKNGRLEGIQLAMNTFEQKIGEMSTALRAMGLSNDQILQVTNTLPSDSTSASTGSTAASPLSPTERSLNLLTGGGPSTKRSHKSQQSDKRKEARTGEKTVEGRDGIARWSPEKKLEFLDAHADEDSGNYKDGHRHFVMRANKIAKCFRDCCNKDVATFLGKHGEPKKGKHKVDFSITKLADKNLPKCTQCHTSLTNK